MSYELDVCHDHHFVPVPHQTGCKRCGYASGQHLTRRQLMGDLCKPARPTRFPELGYRNLGDYWRTFTSDGDAAVGPQYKTKAELLADLERYARDYGL